MLFREMKINKQLLTKEETIQILQASTSGVLGVAGDNDYPYTVPISYAYHDDKLYFHSAKEGHKIDGIKRNEKISFCVIENSHLVKEASTTHFRSVSIFGRARILSKDSERRQAIQYLMEKYSPNRKDEEIPELEKQWDNICLIEVEIEHMTGKAAIELMRVTKG